MTPKERAAMQQALEALREYRDTQMISAPRKAIDALREALTEPQITTPDVCGEVCARAKLCYGCNKDLEEANAKFAEQAEQEPLMITPGGGAFPFAVVGEIEQAEQEPVYAFRRKGLDSFCTCDKERYEELADKPWMFEVTTFYAAPVRTKDLTDGEKFLLIEAYETQKHKWTAMDFIDAVIAADRELNK